MQRKEIIRLKGKLNEMQEKIIKLKRRKRELKRMLPSGSGEQGKYCCFNTICNIKPRIRNVVAI